MHMTHLGVPSSLTSARFITRSMARYRDQPKKRFLRAQQEQYVKQSALSAPKARRAHCVLVQRLIFTLIDRFSSQRPPAIKPSSQVALSPSLLESYRNSPRTVTVAPSRIAKHRNGKKSEGKFVVSIGIRLQLSPELAREILTLQSSQPQRLFGRLFGI